MNTALRASLVGLFTLAACADVRLVEPSAEEEPALSVHVAAVDDESSRYEVNALFRPGMDRRGRPTELADRALYVEGTPVLPVATRSPDTWSYRWQEAGPRGDSLRLTFPVVAGSSPGAYSITVAVPRRDGPRDMDWTRGEDLVLRVSPASGDTPKLSGRILQWRLELGQSCSGSGTGPDFTVTGMHAYPELRVPWQWLETHAGVSLAACFHVVSSFEAAGAPYRSSVTVVAQVRWRIRVVAPA
jgi:hypothetical protein